jgi:hypothetical protein
MHGEVARSGHFDKSRDGDNEKKDEDSKTGGFKAFE